MFFIDNEDPVYRQIGRNMKPHGVKSVREGLEKVRRGYVVSSVHESRALLYMI